MLNISTRISLSSTSKEKIKIFSKQIGGVFTSGSWVAMVKEVKNEISKKLLVNQGLKCVYCERYLIGLKHEIDHFAHKADHPQFSFVPTNLFYSCGFCNSSGRKGQKDTILLINARYNLCTFRIVHPYTDNPDVEIVFKDRDRVFLDWQNCTQKGKNTITFFGFDDSIMTIIRSRELIYQRLNPLASADERKLIQESIAYRP